MGEKRGDVTKKFAVITNLLYICDMESIMKYWLPISCATMLVAGVFTMHFKYSKQQRELSKYQQLIRLEQAANDSLRTYYDKELQAIVAEKQAYVAEKEVLDKFLKERETELYNLRKKYNAKVAVIAELEGKMDTVLVNDTVYVDTAGREIRVATVKDEYRDITVTSTPDSVELRPFRIYTSQSIVIGDDNKVRVIHTNPYLYVNELNSFYLMTPKKQKSKNWKYLVGAGAVVGGLILLK